jgi:hypothetical protein
MESLMKPLLVLAVLVLAVSVLTGCQTDSQGNRESAWEALKRWDESMTETEARLQSKRYND